jgi:hypothetical protein
MEEHPRKGTNPYIRNLNLESMHDLQGSVNVNHLKLYTKCHVWVFGIELTVTVQ